MAKLAAIIVSLLLLGALVGCTAVDNPAPAQAAGNGNGQQVSPPPGGGQPSGGTPSDGKGVTANNCPTDEQMFVAHGFDTKKIKAVATGGGIAWEGCKWTIQAIGIGSYDQPMLPDWQYTVTLDDGHQTVAAFYGEPNLARRIFGATIRYRPAHNNPANNWVNRPCDAPTTGDQGGLLARELGFGLAPERGRLTYQTVSGNIQCGSAGGQTGGGQASAGGITQDWLSANIGGSAEKWIPPDWSGGAWVFRDKGNFVILKYPGRGRMDVWINGTVSITADNAERLSGRKFDETSFHPNG